MHATAVGCLDCHEQGGQEHPLAGKKTFVTKENKICNECHIRLVSYVNVHEPAGSGNCSACHLFHGQGSNKLKDVKQTELCKECHDGVIAEGSVSVHKPAGEGECTKCHNPHGSDYDYLARGEYLKAPYVGYTENAYQLCFSCHSRQLLQFSETSYATEFRDGEVNLHFFHVNKPTRGINCNMCHKIHGSELPKLMAAGVPYGNWMLPLNFKRTETGGSCSPGCHKPEGYDREKYQYKQQLP